MKKRKESFWNMTKNSGHHETYIRWIEGKTIIVPRYLQRKRFANEQENQTTIRANAALNDFRAEIELKKLRAEHSSKRFSDIDKEIIDFFKDKPTGLTQEMLITMWTNEAVRNEEISKRRWKRNEKWLHQYAANFLQEYKDQNPFFKASSEANSSHMGTATERHEQTNPKQKTNQAPSYRQENRHPRQRNVNKQQNKDTPWVRPVLPQGTRNNEPQQQSSNDFLELSDSDSTLT
ncbi:MAG: hypothetical protein JAZ17_11040 [Candidatus Thiodiazotropha endolucinida]|nr:hypothetical protein [Candidatus Thiodiazotropha endolucinida]